MTEYKLEDGNDMDSRGLELYLENIENPPSSTSTQISYKPPMVGTGIKRFFITETLAGTLAISSLGNVFKDGRVKLKTPVFSENSLNDYNNTIEEPHDEYIDTLNKLISHKVNITRVDMVERVMAFRSLNQNWDGYGAIPLEVKSAANAVRFIYFLNDRIIERISDFHPNPNGTFSLVWENEFDERLALELGNNTLSYYVKFNSQDPMFFNDIENNDKEVNRISDFIKAL